MSIVVLFSWVLRPSTWLKYGCCTTKRRHHHCHFSDSYNSRRQKSITWLDNLCEVDSNRIWTFRDKRGERQQRFGYQQKLVVHMSMPTFLVRPLHWQLLNRSRCNGFSENGLPTSLVKTTGVTCTPSPKQVFLLRYSTKWLVHFYRVNNVAKISLRYFAKHTCCTRNYQRQERVCDKVVWRDVWKTGTALPYNVKWGKSVTRNDWSSTYSLADISAY